MNDFELKVTLSTLLILGFILLPMSIVMVQSDQHFKTFTSSTCSGTVLSKHVYSAGAYHKGEVWVETLGPRNTTRVLSFVYPAIQPELAGKTDTDVNTFINTVSGISPSVSISCYVEHTDGSFSKAIIAFEPLKKVVGWYIGLVFYCLFYVCLLVYGVYRLYLFCK